MTPAQKMLVAVEAYSNELDRLEREKAALRKDRDRLDFLESITGSGWALLHLDEGKQLTRKQIDRRMATEPKP